MALLGLSLDSGNIIIGFTSSFFYDVRVGTSSGDQYYYGLAQSPDNILLMRTDSSNTNLWSNTYSGKGTAYAFEIDSAETYIYLVSEDSSNYPLSKVSASDGIFDSTVNILSFKSNFSYVTLRFFKSSDSLFFSMTNSNSEAVL